MQARDFFPSIGAEIIAASSSTDRASLIAQSMTRVYGFQACPTLVLTVDSDRLYSTITTLHERADYRMRPMVSRLRGSCEVGEIGWMQWISGRLNIAGALTKRNVQIYRALNKIMKEGKIEMAIFRNAKRVRSAA